MGKRRFRGSVDPGSNASETSRLSSHCIVTHCCGWDVGVKVTAYVDSTGKDRISIWTTKGSNDPKLHTLIGYVDEQGVWLV